MQTAFATTISLQSTQERCKYESRHHVLVGVYRSDRFRASSQSETTTSSSTESIHQNNEQTDPQAEAEEAAPSTAMVDPLPRYRLEATVNRAEAMRTWLNDPETGHYPPLHLLPLRQTANASHQIQGYRHNPAFAGAMRREWRNNKTVRKMCPDLVDFITQPVCCLRAQLYGRERCFECEPRAKFDLRRAFGKR